MPKFSCLISTYKGEAYLNRRLNNLLNEVNEKDLEVIVLNPASPENDGIIAQNWAARDSRVRYIELDHRNTYGEAWLDMWEVATGDFVTNCNVDDLVDPTFFGKVYHALRNEAEGAVAFCYTGLRVINEQGTIVGVGRRQPFDADVMSYECHAGPCVTWRNDPVFKVCCDWPLMRKRASQHVSAFDYWLWLYFMHFKYKGIAISEPLITYLQRPSSIEHQNYGKASTYESLASIAEFFPHHFKAKLKMFSEFGEFPRLPEKSSWCEARGANKTWKEDKWVNANA